MLAVAEYPTVRPTHRIERRHRNHVVELHYAACKDSASRVRARVRHVQVMIAEIHGLAASFGVPRGAIVRKLSAPEKGAPRDVETVRLPAVAERLQDPPAAAAPRSAVPARAGRDLSGRIAHAGVPGEESGRGHSG